MSEKIPEETPEEITFEQFKSAIKKNNYFHIRNCSICGYPCGFLYDGEQLCYDSGCDCTGRYVITPRNEDELLFYFRNTWWKPHIEKFILEQEKENDN